MRHGAGDYPHGSVIRSVQQFRVQEEAHRFVAMGKAGTAPDHVACIEIAHQPRGWIVAGQLENDDIERLTGTGDQIRVPMRAPERPAHVCQQVVDLARPQETGGKRVDGGVTDLGRAVLGILDPEVDGRAITGL
ncbi:hypothetical protein D3C81_1763510 [compost metagenome]